MSKTSDSCISEIKRLINEIESGAPNPKVTPVSERLALVTTTLHIEDINFDSLPDNGRISLSGKTTWAAERDDWYVVFRTTSPQLLQEVAAKLGDLEHDVRNQTTIWVFPKHQPKAKKALKG